MEAISCVIGYGEEFVIVKVEGRVGPADRQLTEHRPSVADGERASKLRSIDHLVPRHRPSAFR